MNNRGPAAQSRSRVLDGNDGTPPSILPAKRPSTSRRSSVISISSGDEGDEEVEEIAGPSNLIRKNVGVDYKTKYEDLQKKIMAQLPDNEAEKGKDKQLQELQKLLNAREQELEALKNKPVETLLSLETKLESIRTAMQCQICFDLLQRPFAINPCGHEFCGVVSKTG